MNNNTQDYFRESEGGGIDDDNFTNPGSGEGFDSGRDFPSQPVTESSPSRDRNTYEPPENNDDESDSEPPDIPNPFQESEADRIAREQASENARKFSELQENALDEDSLIFDSEYYLEQNRDIQILGSDAQSHFEENGIAEDREYRFLLKEDYTPAPNIFAANYHRWSMNNILLFDAKYYLEQNPDVAAAGVDASDHFSLYGISEDREHRYVLVWDLLIFNEDELEENSADSLSGASESVVGGEPDFSLSTVTESQFDRDYYLVENPDVATAGVDPYEHYISFGQAEGRIPYVDFDPTVAQTDLTETLVAEPSLNFI